MQLPKSRRRQKLREKKCQYPGCGKIFYGIHISKYCTEHRQDRYRIRKRSKPENVNIKNQTIQHPYTEVTMTAMHCKLVGCDHQFEVKLYPRQFVYPKYCPEHRNEYKRIRHLQLIGREDLIDQMKSESDTAEIEYTGAETAAASSSDDEIIRDDVA
ncbi:MAG: hypothetical protein LBH93_07115 [Chitinispirillales bacterium]|jgi:hypothetical protein|nr:hypothetical protein [Chitinispirillales bacterium]